MIWNKIKAGDLDALGNLYDNYISKLYQYGMNICSDKEFVKDSIHDVFLDIYKYRENLCETNNPEYYLLKSLKNKLSKKYHSKAITIAIDTYKGFSIEGLETPSEEENIIELENKTENSIKLKTAMGMLTKQQKKVINLRYMEQMSYSEIAESMNISVETARTIIYRGIKLLRQNMLIILGISFF